MPIISSQIYNNNGTQLLGTIENTDANVFYLKSDGVYRNDTLELAIGNFVGLTQTINGTTPDSGYAVPTPSGNGVALDTSMGETIWYAIQGSSNIQIPITKNGKTTLATKGTENVEDIDINVDISPTIQSLSITPSETSQTFNASNVDGYKPVNVSAIQTETPTVNLSLASGNQTVNASSGKYIKSLTITKPSTLIAENIKKDINIAGITGTLESGGANLNIAYGDTAPSDTSKLWIKGSEAERLLLISGNPEPTLEDTISTLSTTLPSSAYGMGTAAVGTKIYLFGGNTGSRQNTIQVFDTTNDTISTLSTTLPTATDNMGAAAVGTKIYLFGGQDINIHALSTINVFDTTNDTITTLSTTLSTVSYGIGTAAVGTKIYLFGGENDNGVYLNTIQVFDTTNNTISTLSKKLPLGAYEMGTAAVGTKIYLFGGKSKSGRLKTIRVFDTTNNTISTLSTTLPTAVSGMRTAAVGTKIYLFGGVDSSYNILNTINVFSPRIYLNPNSILITEGQQENVFNLLSSPTQVEISVKNVYRGDSSNVAQLNDAYLYDGTNWVNVNTGETS